MNTFYFQVADLTFAVSLPVSWTLEDWLPSFVPFEVPHTDSGSLLLDFEVSEISVGSFVDGEVWSISRYGSGNLRLIKLMNGFQVEWINNRQEVVHFMQADGYFRKIVAFIQPKDKEASGVLAAFIHVVYSQAILLYKRVSVHASAVCLGGKAYLFMGRSGTGKSTHAALWMGCFPDCELLNDDNPIVCVEDGAAWVYGSPWSGKTVCYKNKKVMISGMIRLQQSGRNRFFCQEEVLAFTTILSGCSVIGRDGRLHGYLCDTLVELVGKVKVGLMECRPDMEAVCLCRSACEEYE